MVKKKKNAQTAESMGRQQKEISVSEFFLKNRHLLGFDNPRKALLTTVKEAVDNALDACEEAEILPELSVELRQLAGNRFTVAITDNGPGIVRAQIPKIFAKLLYGSKFHRLKMSRGQQGIGISAAGMYGQLTTGRATRIISKTKVRHKAHSIEVQIDTQKNKPFILKDQEIDWTPEFYPYTEEGEPLSKVTFSHGTCVEIDMESSYVRGRLSVDEYLKQCAVVNPHLQLHYRVVLLPKDADRDSDTEDDNLETGHLPWKTFKRATKEVPEAPDAIKPHPHGVELGALMQMLKVTSAKTLRGALTDDFSRVSSRNALAICEAAGLNPKARPARIAHKESEALYEALGAAKLMRPPVDCLSPIGEEQIIAGLKKEINADFYDAVTRSPAVYRGNPFQVEAGLAYARPGENENLAADDSVRVMRFANRVPLLYMAGACAVSKAVSSVNWKNYGLTQPRGALPLGPVVIIVHIASVWVPFTSESKEAVAHYPEIIKEITACLQECGRKLSVYLRRKRRLAEVERKKNYMAMYIPHMALGLREILDLSDQQEKNVVKRLHKMLERTHLED